MFLTVRGGLGRARAYGHKYCRFVTVSTLKKKHRQKILYLNWQSFCLPLKVKIMTHFFVSFFMPKLGIYDDIFPRHFLKAYFLLLFILAFYIMYIVVTLTQSALMYTDHFFALIILAH